MRVAIVGAGAVGRSIAGELLGNGHTVMLIEKDGRKVRTRAVPGGRVGPGRRLRGVLPRGGPAGHLRRRRRRHR